MNIKTSNGEITAREAMEYRVSTLASEGKAVEGARPVGWHRHGSEHDYQPAVYQKLCINFHTGQAARRTEEWKELSQTFAQEFADSNEHISAEVVLRHLKATEERSGRNSGIKKSEYEEIGRDVVGRLEDLSQTLEDGGEEYHSTKEWADTQIDGLFDDDFVPAVRPTKPKTNQTAASKERERAIQEMRDNDISDEVINKVYPLEGVKQ